MAVLAQAPGTTVENVPNKQNDSYSKQSLLERLNIGHFSL